MINYVGFFSLFFDKKEFKKVLIVLCYSVMSLYFLACWYAGRLSDNLVVGDCIELHCNKL